MDVMVLDSKIFNIDKIYKVVVKENDTNIKTFRGYIVDSNKEYITLKFVQDDVKLFLNHQFIVSIMEVNK